jgi:hypothetical protein
MIPYQELCEAIDRSRRHVGPPPSADPSPPAAEQAQAPLRAVGAAGVVEGGDTAGEPTEQQAMPLGAGETTNEIDLGGTEVVEEEEI